MLTEKLEYLTTGFDFIHQLWERPKTQRAIALIIFCVFIGALVAIECNREGLLPDWLAIKTPTSHFQAIHLAFSLILVQEVMSLILSISDSLSRALGKQFEIMALILLRNAFKELTVLPEPVSLAAGPEPLFRIAQSAAAALIIFICLGFYNHLRKHQNYITNPQELMRYVLSKKLISLVLVWIFFGIAAHDAWLYLTLGQESRFFETAYTVLIFADISLVLISQRFMPTFHAVFRNSGFVIGTLIMRLALSAPSPWDAISSVFAALYVLALTWATNYFGPKSTRIRA